MYIRLYVKIKKYNFLDRSCVTWYLGYFKIKKLIIFDKYIDNILNINNYI